MRRRRKHRLRRVAAWIAAAGWVGLFAAIVPQFPGHVVVAFDPPVVLVAVC